MTELTPREKAIYSYIRDCITRDGFPPSVRDICTALSIKSTSTVHGYLRRLEEKGCLSKSNGKSRAIKLVSGQKAETSRMERVPLLGRVTAGIPVLAIENYDGYVDFPSNMARGRSNLFALRVVGTSMIEAGIMDGDIVIVESRQYADDGDIVVAMIEDEATVKRFYREPNRVRLQPANCTMEPIYARNVSVLGKVIANFRFY